MFNSARPLNLFSAAAILATVLVCGPNPLLAADVDKADKKLQSVQDKIKRQQAESERQKKRALQLKSEMSAISKELVQAAQKVHDHEASVAGVEAELNKLERAAKLKEQKLRERQRQFSGVMMALTRIARFPSEALVAQPIPPEDTVRSAILLRAAVPTIEQRADALKAELDELAEARRKVDDQRQVLLAAVEGLRSEEMRIEGIRKKKAALRAEAISKSRAAQSKARKLAKQAKNLRDLVSKLNKAQAEAKRKAEAEARAAAEAKKRVAQKALALQKSKDVPPEAKAEAKAKPQPANLMASADISLLGGVEKVSKARGKLPYPAIGRVVGRYGQQLDGGLTSKGLSLETRDGARVIAPFSGKVVFSGPFRGYGQLLIIDHGEGYHSLLAGLGRIDTLMDQRVVAGEPVAIMGGDGEEPVLYVEFRRNNQPINPLPWLARSKRMAQSQPKG
ncbi:peptidoglycan DD-metalloendopeptidase family protein [Magnetovibrio sp. PR-2]|uniref:murein hydrolase activator EnvC family protein n=1 Tax=Magnetovibrio sp. PR-2 TaxID=3120356 RepID=UPI002FCE0E1D